MIVFVLGFVLVISRYFLNFQLTVLKEIAARLAVSLELWSVGRILIPRVSRNPITVQHKLGSHLLCRVTGLSCKCYRQAGVYATLMGCHLREIIRDIDNSDNNLRE